MNIQSKGKQAVLDFINKEGRLPTYNEFFDIYTDHVLKEQSECWRTVNGPKNFDKPMWRITSSANIWFKYSVGQLVMEGKLKLDFTYKGE